MPFAARSVTRAVLTFTIDETTMSRESVTRHDCYASVILMMMPFRARYMSLRQKRRHTAAERGDCYADDIIRLLLPYVLFNVCTMTRKTPRRCYVAPAMRCFDDHAAVPRRVPVRR